MRIEHNWRIHLVKLLGFLFCISASASELIPVHSGNLKVPVGRYVIAPYVGEQGAWLHLQPKGQGSEILLDIVSGLLLSRPPDEFKNASRLGFVAPQDISRVELTARLGYLQSLGCQTHNQGCTVLEDDYQLIFVSFSSVNLKLTWEVVDTRPLMNTMRQVFAGQLQVTKGFFTETEKGLIEYAATHTKLREKILDEIEGIDSIDKLERFQESRRILSLCTWKSFTCSDRPGTPLDLRRAEEKQLIRLYSRLLSQRFVEKSNPESGRGIVQFLLKITAPPFPAGDSASYAVDEMRKLPPEDRLKVATYLSAYDGPQRLTIHCFADWVQDRACASSAGRSDQRRAPSGSPAASAESASQPREQPSRNRPTPSSGDGQSQRGSIGVAGAIPEEYLGILNYPNPIRLLSINETSGMLARDNTTIGGVVFTARSLGKISEGKFEISAKVAEGGEVPIRVGSYRVKLDLNLIYLREDSCVGSVRCIFASDSRVSKSENREAVFNLSPDNGWHATNRVSFGHLLPLTEGGGDIYKSELREVRLAVKKSVWNLK